MKLNYKPLLISFTKVWEIFPHLQVCQSCLISTTYKVWFTFLVEDSLTPDISAVLAAANAVMHLWSLAYDVTIYTSKFNSIGLQIISSWRKRPTFKSLIVFLSALLRLNFQIHCYKASEVWLYPLATGYGTVLTSPFHTMITITLTLTYAEQCFVQCAVYTLSSICIYRRGVQCQAAWFSKFSSRPCQSRRRAHNCQSLWKRGGKRQESTHKSANGGCNILYGGAPQHVYTHSVRQVWASWACLCLCFSLAL